jgi:hydrogenase expression/formation protein HypE
MTEAARVLLAHGNGGRFMRELVDEVFARPLANAHLDTAADAVGVPLPDGGEIVLTTDAFTVQPLEFPGGDIGSLAVHGTVNDLAVAGAEPLYLTLNAIIEEGLPVAQLERIAASLARAARAAGVAVVAGDTKVVPRGAAGGLYLATDGVGRRAHGTPLGLDRIRAGDRILVSGPVGDHGIAVLLARESFGLAADVRSDCACVLAFARALRPLPGLRFMRDPTRGGLATVANDLCRATALRVTLDEAAVPVRETTRGVCEMLGYDPFYLACEGRVVAVVDEASAATALAVWRALPGGGEAALIGRLDAGPAHVVLRTAFGGERLLEELEDDPLPRIC